MTPGKLRSNEQKRLISSLLAVHAFISKAQQTGMLSKLKAAFAVQAAVASPTGTYLSLTTE